MKRTIIPALAALLLFGCDSSTDRGPLDISVIGASPRIVDPNRKPLRPGDAVLMMAIAQGLVAFDGGGQIEPGLAIRWDVSDDGLYYTFRLADDASLNAGEVARRLRATIAPGSRNPLLPQLGAIAEIVAVTPQVVEIRLRAPRPALLPLLAQPEMALLSNGAGSGPFSIVPSVDEGILLRRVMLEPDTDPEISPAEFRLRGERAAVAVARYAAGSSSLVLGGTFADLPIARVARLPARQLRFDPAPGLFGLVVADTGDFLGDAANRRALAMAIDRDRLTAAFAVPDWAGAAALAPSALEGLPVPAPPDWIIASLPARQDLARRTIAAWAEARGPVPTLRIALPPGPGSRLLLAALRADWRRIGVDAEAVTPGEDADLRLVDAVAPADVASWYLRRFTCDRSAVCSAEADAALQAARRAPDLAARTAALAEADRLLADLTPFIPIATPLRWSLVSPNFAAFRPNPRAVHPLHHLRAPKD